ncbi:MAG: hypothetical protein GY940_42235, partial [bacterium]|nr:hypothetical protein [bacterium]
GYRIELGEIENRLLDYAGIKEVLVVVKGVAERNLVSYITGEREIGLSELQEYLGRELPGYMIPSYFVQVEEFPLTANGKIDVKALPGHGHAGLTTGNYSAPRNETEEKLVTIWNEILGTDPAVATIGIEDDFFRLGGNSLSLVKLVSIVNKEFNVKIPITEVFKEAKISH